MARSTSASVAMLVSPGVVMASAPCATPHFTAHSTGFAGQEPVDQAGGKAVAAAHSIENVDVALRHVHDLVLVERDGAPCIAAGCLRGAQRAGDELQVRIGRRDFAQHLFVAGDGQFAEVLASRP